MLEVGLSLTQSHKIGLSNDVCTPLIYCALTLSLIGYITTKIHSFSKKKNSMSQKLEANS